MTFDINTLEPSIREILSSPGVDLSTVSAKGVRKQLITIHPDLTPDFVKENKKEIDAIITSVYEQQVNATNSEGQGSVGSDATDSRKRKQGSEETEEPAEDDYDEEEEEPKPKKSKKASKLEQSDAQLARQLQNEINGRPTRAGNKRTNGASKRGGRTKKSSATVDSDEESDGEDGDKPKKKRSGGAKGGFAKEFTLSDTLAAVLNTERLSRPQVVKQLWDYIKGNSLQNPSNKREILCDEGLKAVFGADKIDMFKMNKVLGQHLISETEMPENQ